VPRRWIVETATDLAAVIREEVQALAEGGLKATQGDIRCIAYGHLTRLAVWNLRAGWRRDHATPARMAAVQSWYSGFGGLAAVLAALEKCFADAPARQDWEPVGMVRDASGSGYEIPF